ncbi:MAG: glycosyl transferase family A, partial [Spirulinaceae cyanobacterium]
VLIRSKALDEVGGFDESLQACEDWDMWIRLASRYHFVCVPSPQIFYRVYTSSMSGDVWKMESTSLQLIKKAFTHAPIPLKYLQKESLGNRYKYLTFKAVEHPLEKKKGLAAIRFLSLAIKYDPRFILKTKVLSLVIFKIMVILLLPTQSAHYFITQAKMSYKKQMS